MSALSSPLWQQIQGLSLAEKQQLFGLLYWDIQQQQGERLADGWPLFAWQQAAIAAAQASEAPTLSEEAFQQRMAEKFDQLKG